MCQFNITDKSSKKTISCLSAWDIFDAVVKITGDITEASSSWKKAGHLNIGKTLKSSRYAIKRIA